MPSFLESAFGSRTRQRLYEGSVVVRNALPAAAEVVFCLSTHSTIKRTKAHGPVTIDSGSSYVLDLGPSIHFDYVMQVTSGPTLLVIRGGQYRLQPDDGAGVSVVCEREPERRISDRLASTRGLSFSFSGSGFLCVYQLGAAQCLQDQGITRNPYVQVSGCSGGAATLFSMLYGADLRSFYGRVRETATRIRRNQVEYAGMRLSLLETLASFWRDGSLDHPAFREGRVQVCFTATKGHSASLLVDVALGQATEKRVSSFASPAEAALSLLASASAFFTGMPFVIPDGEGSKEKGMKVADGGFKNNLPVIDSFSVTLKPFSDGWDVIGVSGVKPDIAPSELVPVNWGVYPPDTATIDHLFELGYRDMEAWLDANLDERLAKICASGTVPVREAPLPPVEWSCPDDGMRWLEEVLAAVPVDLREQCKENVGIKGRRIRTLGEVSSPSGADRGGGATSPAGGAPAAPESAARPPGACCPCTAVSASEPERKDGIVEGAPPPKATDAIGDNISEASSRSGFRASLRSFLPRAPQLPGRHKSGPSG